jgi:hypothetical protein
MTESGDNVVATLTGPANPVLSAKYFLLQVAQLGANRCNLVQLLAHRDG